MVGHMAYDTQVFTSTQKAGGHLKMSSPTRKVGTLKGAVAS